MAEPAGSLACLLVGILGFLFAYHLWKPVLCPISPELLEILKRPGGSVVLGPMRMSIDASNTITVELLDQGLAEQTLDFLGAMDENSGDFYAPDETADLFHRWRAVAALIDRRDDSYDGGGDVCS